MLAHLVKRTRRMRKPLANELRTARGRLLPCLITMVLILFLATSIGSRDVLLTTRQSDSSLRDQEASACLHSHFGHLKTICSLRQTCLDFSKPHQLTAYGEVSQSAVDAMQFLTQNMTIMTSQLSWEEQAKHASIVYGGTTVLHLLFQHAFQHFVPDFLNLLPAYWSPELLNASRPNRSLFLTNHACQDCSLQYTNDLFRSALCGVDKECHLPYAYPFELLDVALDADKNRRYWCREQACKDRKLKSVCFERLIVSPTGYIDWFFYPNHRDILVARTLGDFRYSRRICVNQRSGTRRIVNVHEVVDVLEKLFNLDVKLFYFDGLPFNEQVRIIDSCSLLVAPHGGGMTNAVFIRKNATVIEFHPAWYQHIYYYEEAVKSVGASYLPIIVPVEDVILSPSCRRFARLEKDECTIERDVDCQTCFKNSDMRVETSSLTHEIVGRGILHNFRRNI